jgi:tetratricopeptide (TPR) repeat protein
MSAMRRPAPVVFALSVLVLATRASADCPKPNITAINVANEGDRLKATNLDGAIEKFKQAHELDPTSHRIIWKLALAYQRKEQWADVARTSAQALALAPKNANYALVHGIALARQGLWTEAKAALEQTIALDPNLPDAHFELAEVALHLGDEKLALVEYTKTIPLLPTEAAFYGPLADLYIRLGFLDHAEKVLTAGETNAKDESHKFALYSLHGDIRDMKHDTAGAVAMYEAAKKACGMCNEKGQQIAFFNLGAAYASLTPPRKSEAMANLQAFQKMICKGAAAQRYADQCMQAQQLATKMGGTLP